MSEGSARDGHPAQPDRRSSWAGSPRRRPTRADHAAAPATGGWSDAADRTAGDVEAAGGVRRRDLLRWGVLGATAGAALTRMQWPAAAAGSAGPSVSPPAAGLTTADRTLLRGTPGAGGWVPIVVGPGEPHIVRTDLIGAFGSAARAATASRARRRRSLVSFAQLTDIHVVDCQSPARVEFFDRYDDPDSPYAALLPFTSSWRAQEMLSAQVSAAMVDRISMVGRGPVTGRPLAFTVATGDNIDNMQFNELRWHIDTLDGGIIRADSGDLSKYEGVQDFVDYDVHYWHPDGNPTGQPADRPHTLFGFPNVPGLLDAFRRPFRSRGLRTPWYTTFGNHDGLLQGNFPPLDVLAALAVGDQKIIDIPPGSNIIEIALGLQSLDPATLALLLSGPKRTVTADPNRHVVTRAETVKEHFKTRGWPRGHGFTGKNLRDGTAFYSFDRGPFRFISMDTVNPNGGADGSLDADQAAWVESLIQGASSSRLDAHGRRTSCHGRDKLVVLFSHHTSWTMGNVTTSPIDPRPRVDGPTLLSTLLKYPNVVLWVNGHTHQNVIMSHARPSGGVAGGFWEVNTASHIDWPEQGRLVEVADNCDGTLSIFGTIIDSGAPAEWNGRLNDHTSLASLSRLLAANDWQQRARPNPAVDGLRGAVQDRNVELLIPAPFDLSRFSAVPVAAGAAAR